MSGIYIHIPFCRSKCGYCAFYSRVGAESSLKDFLVALEKEFSSRQHELISPVNTIYIGGGTPSLLPAEAIMRIAAMLEPFFSEDLKEFTIEVNPDDVSDQKIGLWKSIGVNRVSMGVQSFVDRELSIIGRRHDSSQARRAVEKLTENFSNVSLDLIFGLPSQSYESWKYSVDSALGFKPQHISAYSLTFEERTRFSHLLRAGEIAEADEDLSENMFSYLNNRLADEGYLHYEISNFALPGFHSVHNSSYWKGIPYLGLGPGASSYDGRFTRRSNPGDLKKYVGHFKAGSGTPFYTEETLGIDELQEEYILTRLRTAKGISIDEFSSAFGAEAASRLAFEALKLVSSGNIVVGDGKIRLTEAGFLVSDSVIVSLL